MKQLGRVGIWALAVLQFGCSGCSGASQNGSSRLPARTEGEPQLEADNPPSHGRRDPLPSGHVFRPLQHPPHTFPTYRKLPVEQLPSMVERHGCYELTEHTWPPPFPRRSSSYGGSNPASPEAKKRAAPAEASASVDGAPGARHRFESGVDSRAPSRGATNDSLGQSSASNKGVASSEQSQAPGRYPMAQEAREAERGRPDLSPQDRDDFPPQKQAYNDWGASLYLSNDDTMSLSSAQRVLFAIDNQLEVPPEHIRPHEFLNYFSFDTTRAAPDSDFSVHASIAPKSGEEGLYTLALSVAGRNITNQTRRNAGLTFVIDRSGSMASEGRMSYLTQGLRRMSEELKAGDLVNIVLFDDSVCTPLENFVVGRDPMSVLERTISRLRPRGSTNLHAGLKRGYELANQTYRDEFTNRVVLISDALANTGVVDPQLLSMVAEGYDRRRVRLSGVGVGSDFNDSLLDRLTERGKGAYVFLGSEAEVDAVFGARFASLIETVANDVHFRLHLPPSLRMNTFYGEESSVAKSEVQAIHYFAGTSQLFLSDVISRHAYLPENDDIMLTIEYEHPETGAAQVEEFAFTLGDITDDARNVLKGRLVTSFIDGVKDIELSRRGAPTHAGHAYVEHGSTQCAAGRASLRAQAAAMGNDPEVSRVLSLWDTYCARFPASSTYSPPHGERPGSPRYVPERSTPRNPERRSAPRGSDVWPSAMK